MYKLMKTFKNKVEYVSVYSSRTEFRRYLIEVDYKGLGTDIQKIYQNNKPTIAELREYKARVYNL